MASTDPAKTARWMVLASAPVLDGTVAGVGPVATEESAQRLKGDLERAGWEPSELFRYFSAAEAREMIAAARKAAGDG